jgi:hypothetical protein
MWQRVFKPEPKWRLPEYTWGEERQLCKRCKHYRERIGGPRSGEQNVVMVCSINKSRTGGLSHGTCIDMRYDGECGREGRLFEEKTT